MSSSDRLNRLSLRTQICALTVLALAVSLLVMGWVTYDSSSRLARDLTLDKVVAKTRDAAQILDRSLQRARVYAITTPAFPPIPGLVRCWDNGGVDPVDEGSNTDKWLDRLATILQAQMRANPMQAYSAVIDETGTEILKVHRRAGRPMRIEAGSNVRQEKHFSEAMLLKTDQVYVNAAQNDEESLVVRLATPFFADPPGQARGVFVIGVNAKHLLASAVSPLEHGWTDIVDQQGMYLFSDNPDNQITVMSSDRYEQIHPVRGKLLKTDFENDSYADYILGNQRPNGIAMLAAYQKVYYSPEDRSRFWAIAPSVVATDAMKSVSQLAWLFVTLGLVVLVVGAVITFLAAGGLTSSLRRLAKAADTVAGGELDAPLPEVHGVREVNTLYNSLSAMTTSLRDKIQSLSDEKQKTEAVFQSTADALITIDEEGLIQTFNAMAETMFGYRASEVIGTNVSQLAPSPHREQHDSYLQRYQRTGQAHIINSERELEAVRKDGTVFPISLRVREIIQEDARIYIGTVQDITARKAIDDERNQLFDAIRDAVNRLSDACQEITSTTSQQAAGAQQQATAVTETVATVEQISQTAEQAAERAGEVAQSARQAQQVGEQGQLAVQNSVNAMDQVKNEVESIAESILALAERAQAISDIIATVSDLAEQTNVLALNAAVEASRAGEHGKGFSVVASEVKSLAEQSKKATAQVREILGEIQQAMNQTVLSTEQGTKSTSAAESVVSQAGETIHSLTQTLTQSARLAMQISASANQQAAGLVQLNLGIKNIDTVAKQNAVAISQIEDAATRLSGLSHELASLTSNGKAE